MRRFFFSQLVILLANALAASAQDVILRVASETFPAGGFAQIKVFADSPALIANGVIALDLDPRIFGPITSISAFSASGDAMVFASVTGTHVEATIGAPSGGLGQLPGLPVFVVRAPVLPNAPSSGSVALSLPQGRLSYPISGSLSNDYPNNAWNDPTGRGYKLTLVSGRLSIGQGIPSIAVVTPGTGLLPIGTQLEITGTGFSASQQLTADGLRLTDVQFLSPTRITAKMGAARELTGVAFHLAYAGTQAIDFFAAPESAVPGSNTLDGAQRHVVLPLVEQQSGFLGSRGNVQSSAIMLNAGTSPADVLVRDYSFQFEPLSARRFTLGPGEIATAARPGSLASTHLSSSAPLRIASIYSALGFPSFERLPPSINPPPIQPLNVNPPHFAIVYETGSPAPAPVNARAYYHSRIQDVAIDVRAGPWLKVTTRDADSYKEFTLAFETAGLTPGSYQGIITITPRFPSNLQAFTAGSSTLTVSLEVSNQPTLQVQPTYPESFQDQISPSSLDVSTNGSPSRFTVRTVPDSSRNWFRADITSGTTPARINLIADSQLPSGLYSGKVFIEGPINMLDYSVSLRVGTPPAPLQASPTAVSFVREIGAPNSQGFGTITFSPTTDAFSYTMRTEDGGNWLQTTASGVATVRIVSFTINATGLAPGDYRATITGTADSGTAQATILLRINAKPTSPPSATPSVLNFTTTAGVESPAQTVTITSAQPAFVSLQGATAPIRFSAGSGVLGSPSTVATPLSFAVYAYSDFPGRFEGVLRLSTQGGTVTIPCTVNVTPRPEQPPTIASLLNAGSHRPSALAPGEIITIHGVGIGPATTGLTLDPQGRVRTDVNANSRVMINGVDAPIVYASANQWNVVVPYEVEGSTTADVQVFVNGVPSAKWTLPVLAAAPAIFTQTSTGVGQAAVLNQDNTTNGPSNRAPAGTVVQIYATGAGQVIPAGTTGSVAGAPGSTRLPVKVFFGPNPATVTYAGPAPGFVAGVLQINAIVPSFALDPVDYKLQLQIGEALSPLATISVGP